MLINKQCSIQLPDSEKLLDSNENETEMCIEFSNLSYKIRQSKKERKVILNDISGYFRPKKLSAIIGPSGAGKTSFLNIIAGHKQSSNSDSSITINGIERNIESFRKKSCYVPQEFALLPLLTVKEALYIAARLKLGKNHDDTSKENTVLEVAEKLGLTECLKTLTQHLSGGERKRLSIGVEVITSPAVMLLDEPTSGLDSTASNQVVSVLRVIAQIGCTVVCTIHQPSSQVISQFDDITVISKGTCYYCGPREELLDAFKDAGYTCPKFYNIAEFVLEVITEQRGGNLEHLRASNYERYITQKSNTLSQIKISNKTNNETVVQNPVKEYLENDEIKCSRSFRSDTTSFWEQMNVLFYRTFICVKRDNAVTKLKFAAHIVVALLLGAIFYNFGQDAAKVQSNIACIFFYILFLFFANSMPAVQLFPLETAVFVRENLNNWYTLHVYHITKVLSDFPIQVLCSSSFLLIAYPLTGQPLEPMRFFQVWCIGILITILGQSFGTAIGAAFNTEMGFFIIPTFNIPMLLFGGFFVKLQEIPAYLHIFTIISYFRYAFEGMLQAIYGSNRHLIACSTDFCYIRSPQRILLELNMPSVSFYVIITALLSWIISLHLIIYAVLRWKIYASVK